MEVSSSPGDDVDRVGAIFKRKTNGLKNAGARRGEAQKLSSTGRVGIGSKFRKRRGSRKGKLSKRRDQCDHACEERDGHICFEASTQPGFDRWFRVTYSVVDGYGESAEVFSVDAIIRNSQSAGASNCEGNFLVLGCERGVDV